MVEKLPQTPHSGTRSALRAVATESLLQTRTSGLVVVGGVASLGDAEAGQSARLAFQTGVLLADESGAGRRREGDDEVDAFRCRVAGWCVVVEVRGGGAVGARGGVDEGRDVCCGRGSFGGRAAGGESLAGRVAGEVEDVRVQAFGLEVVVVVVRGIFVGGVI